ncbi:two-CW domain-containing protein [Clostridium cellulovorans]|uniref:Uncharacterized protein n=1 Tax=Clostridium cellulovorans (strain ATCC 35296 / DSM 3052 / OCM 3 / 743B) TaxID=573061 RepID=D9SUQ9_CLOC7|nr:hypothetical protein [Clostridium cellulovorans]ADL50964.1 hypothetical protein Clocel_1208 [Clostridium cellulovorans 743B]
MAKQNCWEFKKCGRHVGGEKVKELGVCPAANNKVTDEINNGSNGGRICWAIAGTLCGGKVQGSYADKQISCMSCDFFKKVKNEEAEEFESMPD